MAIGGSVAGARAPGGRLVLRTVAGDAAGVTDTPTEYTATTASYNPPGDPGGGAGVGATTR